jgi:hypothetical protein
MEFHGISKEENHRFLRNSVLFHIQTSEFLCFARVYVNKNLNVYL